ncbi:AMP-dependent synthetase/ligase [Amycolatopsis acidiphila]|uniref:Acyl-CoA synthetase n=1 Tax=Amycolatopsis acidiphila TaxID=715473 RepID=A0A558A6I4_9PSEU|nr:AMP-dependent synthetase/ligase [Amycolatopsis acidiphila]TVT19867.1 long-chain fatty acid--CoA ligase [Amycolatopsis acidiphila]UIJ58776.1 AMP-dependent synthetase/ligase [Amycolatopsis acidiphila]GHG71877.1 long-chain acyl-CoA synthetase [Amycolatopsis acidiphila]
MTSQTSVADRANGQTIVKLLRRNAEQYADLPALTSLDAEGEPTLTWGQVRHEVAVLSRGLADLGLTRGDRMLIMAPSSPDHLIADLAAVHLAAIPCTAYATLSPDQIRFVARHSAAPIVVLQGTNELKRWEQVLDDLPTLRHIVMVESEALPTGDGPFVSLEDLRRRGAELHEADPEAFERAQADIQPSDPLSMIYTSGTTGEPKGVVLSHSNAVHESYAIQTLHEMPMHLENIAYLPLAHIAERQVSIYLPITMAGHVHTLADASGIVGALARVHPQGFFAVPRVWEKMVAGLKNMLASVPEDGRTALLQANELLQKGYKLRDAGEEVPADLAGKIAETDRTVLAPIRQMLGLDKLIFCSSGAAALPLEVLYFIAGLGLEIHEVWGLSETTGAVTANSAKAFRAGTVGRPVADTEVKRAEDGELLVRGPLVFLGYLQEDGSIKPAVDDEGWYATGDIGEIDADGFVRITDRKKELIITSGGKNIAPTRIEGLLKEHPLIGQAVAIGNDRPYVTALIVLDDEILPGWAAAQGIEFTDVPTLSGHAAVREEIERAVESANSRLARVEQIKRYELIAKPWTPESGELTPTLKLKRRIINDRYAEQITTLYS